MNLKQMNTAGLQALTARPGEHQQGALDELQARAAATRAAYWTARYVDAQTVRVLSTSDLREALQFKRISQEQFDVELQRRYPGWLTADEVRSELRNRAKAGR